MAFKRGGIFMSIIRIPSLRARTLGVLVIALAASAMPGAAIAGKPSGGGGGKCPAGSVKQSTGGYCIIPVTTSIEAVDANGLPATVANDGRAPTPTAWTA
jgi:hypothetical protein